MENKIYDSYKDIQDLLGKRYEAASKEELTVLLLEYMAKEHDGNIQSDLLYGLVEKYVTVSKALEEKVEEVKRLSMTDPLTGIYNRLKFNEAFEQELERYLRYKEPFSIMMLDIDHFKSVNDTYGHDIGDETLIKLTKVIKEHMRLLDIFARWGGEEFIIMSVKTSKTEALILAERIRKSIEEADFSSVPSVTVSIGVATIIRSDDIGSVTKRADQGLYISKENGRNQVTFVEEEE